MVTKTAEHGVYAYNYVYSNKGYHVPPGSKNLSESNKPVFRVISKIND